MSEYTKLADEAEKQLKNISSTMCYAKWAQASIHLTNGMTQSCYHPPLHKINLKDIKQNPAALHNTEQKKLERKMMLHGERPPGCSYCWKIEDLGSRSDRIFRSGEEWAQASRKDIFEHLDKGDMIPRYLEVNFNATCNFKCMYCSPHLSSTWEDEIKTQGSYTILDYDKREVKHNDTQYLDMPIKVSQHDNPYIEAFWKWWPTLYRKLEVFRMTGGEPLMDANMFKVLDYIQTHPDNRLEVSITSNFCPPKQELLDKFIEKIQKLEEIQIWHDHERFNPGSGNHWYVNMALKNFSLFISLDSVGEQAEYIRDGLDYRRLQNNVNRFLKETCNSTVTFINTFNVLSVPKIKEYLQYILELRGQNSKEIQGIQYVSVKDRNHNHPDYVLYPRQRVWFDTPVLRNPAWQNVKILPKEYTKYLEEAIDFMKQHTNVENYVGFYDFEIQKLERNLSIMKEKDARDPKLKIDKINFHNFFQEYDNRRGKNFCEVFPELAKFYLKCGKLKK